MDILLKLQPKTNAPFNKRGRGNTGYLFDANKAMFEFIIEQIALERQNEKDIRQIKIMLNLDEKKPAVVSTIEMKMKLEEVKAKQLSSRSLAEQVAKEVPQKAQKSETLVYYRSPYIKEMVKQFADGRCQMCGGSAPFYDKDDNPYLEEHHVKRLADGGSDTIDNVVAICPNCHRKVHVLNDEKDMILLEGIAKQNQKQYERLLLYAKKYN